MLIELVATLTGAVLAVAVGIWLFRHQGKRTDDKRRDELRSLLKAELSETLQKMKEQPSDNLRTIQDYVQPLIIEEAVKSGLFTGTLNHDLLKLAKTYRRYNIHVASMTDAILQGRGPDSEEYKGLDGRLRLGEKEVRVCSRDLLRKLG